MYVCLIFDSRILRSFIQRPEIIMTSEPETTAGQQKFNQLRQEYPFLQYSGYEATIDNVGLHVTYEFNLSNKYTFRPAFSIPKKRFYTNFPTADSLNTPLFANLLFQVGLIELVSYWKATCSPDVIVKGSKLTSEQVLWWKNVYYQGLGEFFYTNGITTDAGSFMQIFSEGETMEPQNISLDETVIVPIGGGKDSVVTLELLADTKKIRPFIMNPRGATLECVRIAGFGND